MKTHQPPMIPRVLALPVPGWHTCVPTIEEVAPGQWREYDAARDELAGKVRAASSATLAGMHDEHARFQRWLVFGEPELSIARKNQLSGRAREVQRIIEWEIANRFKAQVAAARSRRSAGRAA